MCFLYQLYKQAERIIDLSVTKNFLVFFGIVINIFENLIKLFIRLQLFQFHFSDPVEQRCVVGNEVSHFPKGSHNENALFNCKFASKYR